MKTKRYPHVTGVYGDNGENPSALAITAVLDPSDNYPEAGRIIVGSPTATPGIEGYIPNLGGFNGGPDAIERLAATLNQAARDVRAVIDAGQDTVAPPVKLDLDKLEAIATAAIEEDGEVSVAAWDEHIAAASPPVVLALIARIRVLQRTVGQSATLLEAKSDVAARREWAKRIRVYAAEGAEVADAPERAR